MGLHLVQVDGLVELLHAASQACIFLLQLLILDVYLDIVFVALLLSSTFGSLEQELLVPDGSLRQALEQLDFQLLDHNLVPGVEARCVEICDIYLGHLHSV